MSRSCSASSLALVLPLIAAMACSNPKVTAVDAGTHDAGPADAGAGFDAGPRLPDGGYLPASQPLSAGCTQDSDCVSAACDTQVPGGFCTQTCTDNTSCPDGGVCEETGGGSAYCVALCTESSQCGGGSFCLGGGADVCVPSKGCMSNSDCGSGNTCDTTTGLCSGAIPIVTDIGATCMQDADCTGGRHPFCIPDSSDFWGGYCSSYCHSSSTCGTGNQCVNGLTSGPSGEPIGLCLQGCTSNTDCRSEYNCLTVQDQSFCFPYCKTDMDCLYTGQTCDSTSGLCSGGPDGGLEDAGTMDAGSMDAGSPDGGADAGVDAGPIVVDGGLEWDGGYPAPFPPPPQVVSQGGPVLKSPKLVPIFFSNDDPSIIPEIASFDSEIGGSDYWTTAVSQYGVGPATSADPIMVNEIATGTLEDTSIETWIQNHISSGVLPKPDSNTLYILHYPEPMTIVLSGELSCQYFGGYHNDFLLSDGTDIAYAVLPRCTGSAGETLLQQETSAESHEIVEGSTDPYPQNDPAYIQADNAHLFWEEALGGSEVGDMCAQDPAAFVQFPGLPFTVQRIWSNEDAKEGHDPCQPELPNEVYFNGSPDLPDMILTDLFGPTIDMVGIDVSSGQAKVVPVYLYSEGPTTGPWNVQVEDLNGGQSTVSYSLNQSSGQNGDVLKLTVTPTMPNPGNLDIFFVVSTSEDGSSSHFWVGVTGQ